MQSRLVGQVSGYECPEEAMKMAGRVGMRHFFRRVYIMPSAGLFISSVLSIASPWFLVQAIDRGIVAGDMAQVWTWSVLAAASQLVSGLMRFWGECRVRRHALREERSCLCRMFEKTMGADLRSFPEIAQGRAMGQIIFSSGSERFFIETLYSQGIPVVVTGLGTFWALIYLSWKLAILSFLIIPFGFVLWFWMKRRIGPATREAYERRERLYREIVDSLRAMCSIRALHREQKFIDGVKASSEASAEAGYAQSRALGIQGPFFDGLQAFVILVVFVMGGYGVTQGSVTIGILLGFQLYLSRLFGLMRSGTGLFGAWQQYLEGRARACEIEGLPKAEGVKFERTSGDEVLRLRDVCFSFGERTIWKDENLVIHKGEKKAILLPSGGGKTTLARCILGLYPLTSGRIAIPEGDPVCIGFVPQENVLFDVSLRENIAIAGDLEDEVYRRLLKICGLEALSERLGEERAGEQGARLSGGEQRRVLLARALSLDPRLLIIDQMASELEPELCRKIFTEIREAMPEMGILYLGHREPEWND